MEPNFENLPKAVSELSIELKELKALILKQNIYSEEKPEILSIREVAQFLGLSIPTLYGYVQKREIPFCKKGKRLYFIRAEILHWIQLGRRKTGSE